MWVREHFARSSPIGAAPGRRWTRCRTSPGAAAQAPHPRRLDRGDRKGTCRRAQARRALRRASRARLPAGAAGDPLRAADSRAPGPRGGPPPSRRSRSRAPATRPPQDSLLPSRWRVPWDRPVMSSSQGWRAGSIERAHLASLETCGVGVLAGGYAKPYPTKLCRRWSAWSKRRVGLGDAHRNGVMRAIFRVASASRRDSPWASQWSRRRGTGVAHHGDIRARSEPPGLRRARLSPRSSRRRNQRSPEAGSVDLH